jgi:hypothetical protein
MKKTHEQAACVKIYPKAQAWYLKNIRKFKKPIPVKGKLGIYDLELDLKKENITFK